MYLPLTSGRIDPPPSGFTGSTTSFYPKIDFFQAISGRLVISTDDFKAYRSSTHAPETVRTWVLINAFSHLESLDVSMQTNCLPKIRLIGHRRLGGFIAYYQDEVWNYIEPPKGKAASTRVIIVRLESALRLRGAPACIA